MRHARIPSILVASCLWLAGGAAGSAAQEGGPVGQLPADNAAKTADPQDELKALINSPEARSVAAFRCSSGHSDCPLEDSNAGTLEARFDDTLQTGTGASTTLVTTLTKLLEGTYGNDAVWPTDVGYAIVHLVKFSDDGKSNRGRWLLFKREKGKITASAGTRIMGSKRVAVVFVHLGVLVKLERFDAKAGNFIEALPSEAASARYSNVEYRAIARPKLPINIQRLLGLLGLAAGAAQGEREVETRRVSVLGFGVYAGIPVPSDLTVFGARIDTVPERFGTPITYDNEGKYFWDASVAVPINKITLLDYDEKDGTFTPKTLNKQSIYGTINIYPFPVDIKDGALRFFVPRALIGIGMTGRPGENFLIGGAFGIKEFQIFVGSAFANQRVLKPGADPANGANYTQRYASRLSYGINVPVAAALKKLSGSK